MVHEDSVEVCRRSKNSRLLDFLFILVIEACFAAMVIVLAHALLLLYAGVK